MLRVGMPTPFLVTALLTLAVASRIHITDTHWQLLSPGATPSQAAGPSSVDRVLPSVTFLSVNDVYKLIGLATSLPYYYYEADHAEVKDIASKHCDCMDTSDNASKCGFGVSWESCFPLHFPKVKEHSMKDDSGSKEMLPVIPGPCGEINSSSSTEEYGHVLDFMANFKWLKEEIEADGNIAIGTLAGDFIAPSYLAELHKGKQLIEPMNHMGIDLVNIGNHDVDFGLEKLQEHMEKSAFHYLNANLENQNPSGKTLQQSQLPSGSLVKGHLDKSHPASPWRSATKVGPGFAMLKVKGVKICVLGTTDVDKMAWSKKKVDATERDIPAAISIMREWENEAEPCMLKIAMTHTRSGNDLNLFHTAESAGLHLDAIIGGHDHYAGFMNLNRLDGGKTWIIKAGSDARVISKLTFDFVSKDGKIEKVVREELVPVVAGSCLKALEQAKVDQKAGNRPGWWDHSQKIFTEYVSQAEEAGERKLGVQYAAFYDTGNVRMLETRAVNLWLDLMRESLQADAVFFQAGLIRQEMLQDFVGEGVELSEIFMLEEFPWPNEDTDSRSSLFPFQVSVEALVEKTFPWLMKSFWCSPEPFVDPNRIHISGFVIEAVQGKMCGEDKNMTITFVGGCHKNGGLKSPLEECCTSPACGRLWTLGAWDPRVTTEMKETKLTVMTSQHCTTSKWGSHGPGFQAAGMECKGVEDDNATHTLVEPTAFQKPLADKNFDKWGFPFKEALLSMLNNKGTQASSNVSQWVRQTGFETVRDCDMAKQVYSSSRFLPFCKNDVGGPEKLHSIMFPRLSSVTASDIALSPSSSIGRTMGTTTAAATTTTPTEETPTPPSTTSSGAAKRQVAVSWLLCCILMASPCRRTLMP